MPQVVAEYVDRLCTIEIAPDAGNMPRGTTHRMYAAARGVAGEPLTYAVARRLCEAVRPGDYVLIMTGAGGPPVLPCGETDGLPGGAYLARAVSRALGARVVLLTEERVVEPMRAACLAAGLSIAASPTSSDVVAVIATALGDAASETQAEELFTMFRPSALIGIEKLAPNRAGVIHGATGINYHAMHTNPRRLFELASAAGCFTVGIGDGGNEIGFGNIVEAVRDIMPAGATCQCPCGGGSASTITTDCLVVAAISDWGALGVVAVLGYLLKDTSLLPSEDDYEKELAAVVAAGALDGVLGTPTLSDDGVPLVAQRGFIALLRTLVEVALTPLDSPGH